MFLTKPPTAYVHGLTIVNADDLNYHRLALPNAVDGVGGGTYTLASKLIFNGTSGLRCEFSSTGLEIAGLGGCYVKSGSFITFESGSTLTLNAGSTTNFNGNLSVGSGSTLTIQSGGTLAVASGGTHTAASGSATNLNGTTTVGSGGTITAASGSTTNLNGAVSRLGALTLSGSSATTVHRVTTVTDANSTLDVSYDEYRCATPLAGTRTHTLRSSTAPLPSEGMRLRIWRDAAGAFDINIVREDTSAVATLPSSTLSSVDVTYYATGGWRVTGGHAFT